MKACFVSLAMALALIILHSVAWSLDVITHRDVSHGYEITYFANWEESDHPGNPAFFIKRKSATEPGTISVHIAKYTGAKDELMSAIKSSPEQLIGAIQERFPTAQLVEHGETYLGSFPAYFTKTKYTIKNLSIEIELTVFQVFCIKGQKIYLINFEAPSIIYEKTYPEFEAMIASFNFR